MRSSSSKLAQAVAASACSCSTRPAADASLRSFKGKHRALHSSTATDATRTATATIDQYEHEQHGVAEGDAAASLPQQLEALYRSSATSSSENTRDGTLHSLRETLSDEELAIWERRKRLLIGELLQSSVDILCGRLYSS